jgi:hypothetical protein
MHLRTSQAIVSELLILHDAVAQEANLLPLARSCTFHDKSPPQTAPGASGWSNKLSTLANPKHLNSLPLCLQNLQPPTPRPKH